MRNDLKAISIFEWEGRDLGTEAKDGIGNRRKKTEGAAHA